MDLRDASASKNSFEGQANENNDEANVETRCSGCVAVATA